MTAKVTLLDELVELVAGFDPEDLSGAGTTVQQLREAASSVDPALLPDDQIHEVFFVLDVLQERVHARGLAIMRELDARGLPYERPPAGVLPRAPRRQKA